MNIDKSTYHLMAVTGVLIGIVGCATPAKNPKVEVARAALAAAEQNPQVNQYAPVSLKDAEDQFNKAESSWKKGEDDQNIDHQAYLAKQRVAIAVERAKLGAAEHTVKEARAERDRVRIQAHAKEAELARKQAEQARIRTKSLQEEVQQLKAHETERGLVLTLNDVLFDYDKARLNSGAYRTMDRLAGFMHKHKNRTILIEGFTDSRGSQEYNQRLSEQRANAVREALLHRGVSANRIRVRGYGEAFPVASNDTLGGRAQNRRVEVIISDENGTIPERGA